MLNEKIHEMFDLIDTKIIKFNVYKMNILF